MKSNLCLPFVALSLCLLPVESDHMLTCEESAQSLSSQVKAGVCHIQKSTESLSLSGIVEEPGMTSDESCRADCEKRWSLMQVATLENGCMPFCQDNGCPCLKPWVDRCVLKSCANCTECGNLITSSASTPEPPASTPEPPAAPRYTISD